MAGLWRAATTLHVNRKSYILSMERNRMLAHHPTARSTLPASTAPERGAVLAKATARAAELLGLNGSALAAVIGASEATVSRILRGERGPQQQVGAGWAVPADQGEVERQT